MPLFLVEAISLQLGKFYTLGVSASVVGADRVSGDSGFDKNAFPQLFTAEVIMLILAYTNALWNFLIYSLHYREFQTGLNKLKTDVKRKFGLKKKKTFRPNSYNVSSSKKVPTAPTCDTNRKVDTEPETTISQIHEHDIVLNTETIAPPKMAPRVPPLLIPDPEGAFSENPGFNNFGYDPDNVVTQPGRIPTRATRNTEVSMVSNTLELPDFQGGRVRRISEVTACTVLDSPRSLDFESESSRDSKN